MTTYSMYDSVDVSAIPSGSDAVAGYVGGLYKNFGALIAKFPHLPAVSIAVNKDEDAQCLDVERGDATPAEVPGWLDRMAKAHPNVMPIIYTSASQVKEVRAAAGSRKFLIWSAHYGKGKHICSPAACGYPVADATQYDDKGPKGEHIDVSLLTPLFFSKIAHRGTAVTPPPVKPPVVAPVPPGVLTKEELLAVLDGKNAKAVTNLRRRAILKSIRVLTNRL